MLVVSHFYNLSPSKTDFLSGFSAKMRFQAKEKFIAKVAVDIVF
jgi:hypothetical protein